MRPAAPTAATPLTERTVSCQVLLGTQSASILVTQTVHSLIGSLSLCAEDAGHCGKLVSAVHVRCAEAWPHLLGGL